ncbi:hypothetical protein N7470_009275 [Penicillium chermesinum]|nr:hypothetical protein N7470_009275 [Penicillium chermesinum]
MFFPVRPNNTPRSSKTSKNWKQRPKRSSQLSQVRSTPRDPTKDPEPDESTARSVSASTSLSDPPRRRSSMPGVDIDTAHSKEDVRTKQNIPTPDPTDLTEDNHDGGKENRASNGHTDNHHAPPSPPLTGLDQPASRKGTPDEEQGKEPKEKSSEKVKAKKSTIKIRTSDVNRSTSSLRSKKDEEANPSSKHDEPSRTRHRSSKSKASDEKKPKKRSSRSTMSPSRSNNTVRDIGWSLTTDPMLHLSPRTNSISLLENPPRRPLSRHPAVRLAQPHRIAIPRVMNPSNMDDTLRPAQRMGHLRPLPRRLKSPSLFPGWTICCSTGGLDAKVPRTLLAGPFPSDPFAQSATQPQQAAARVFEPFNRLLDDYSKVMSKNGSIAVATGYRSVARRLLDRLEAVFARDISSEPCSCLMCEREDIEERPEGLPAWPPFVMAPTTVDMGLGEEHVPMQKLDVDVPEEYREHFIRQSRKTKVAVDKWLSEQPDQASSAAPEEETMRR